MTSINDEKGSKPIKTTKQTKPKKRDFDNIPKPAKPSVTAGGKTTYLTNKDLVAEVTLSKQQGKMSNTLAAMLQLLCSRYAKRGQFANYTYNDDMQAFALYMLVKTWNRFNEQLYSNAFAFYTQCIKNSFRQFLNQEKRQRTIRDLLLVEQGMNPSFRFTEDYEGNNNQDDYEGGGWSGEGVDMDLIINDTDSEAIDVTVIDDDVKELSEEIEETGII